MAQTGSSFPEQLFFLRDRDGLSLHVGPPNDVAPHKSSSGKIPCLSAQFSRDGSMLAAVSASGVLLVETNSGREIQKLDVPGVLAVSISPKGTYLQTYHRASAAKGGEPQEKNLNLWDISTGAPVFQLFQKVFQKSSWPSVQFSEDEAVACRLVTNEVHFYDGKAFSRGIVDKLRLQGIASTRLSFSPGSHIAAYVPEAKGAPASVRVFQTSAVGQGQPVARRSFFRSSTVQFHWNKGSSGVLIVAQSDVDKTNKSYYGESSLHFLASDGSYDGAVPLSKEGPIHDVQWAPSGNAFVVVHGFMPAKAILFDSKCKPLFDFGSASRNFARWSPKGRFLLLAGFGNLPGDLEFWDAKALDRLCSTRAECTVSCEWSPNGRYVMTATTAPRLNVDNGIKMFKYDGTLVYEKKFELLYQAEWRPVPDEVYPDLPASPRSSKKMDAAAAASSVADQYAGRGTSASKPVAAQAAGQKPAAYRPPHLAGRSSAAFNVLMSGSDDKPHRIGALGQAVTPPGAHEMSKSALKNKKRREKEKQKASERASGVGTAAAGDMPPAKAASDSTAVNAMADEFSAMSTSPAVPDASAPDSSGEDVQKRIRAIQKKLRQIEELKNKAAEAGGLASLAEAQRVKVASEGSLIKEIENLQAQLR
ncbi:hypothetical protein CBR_g53754 [Chara braunii]|uniref:Eukaryotic translation initiation factor 2A n=1 Tax=Chara braunii TaxID=69332 RepID=A0A388MBI1_CHABU|nr:hypothetical protein CBR_g53754 [Chara braunii]|eukprot:GBG91863.1 hypothetical protein CBR_g53754 [Chara braunii]